MKNPGEGRAVLSADDMLRSLRRLAHEVVERNRGARDLVLVGLRTRGVPLAERLARLIEEFEGSRVPVGYLDITLYRDDLHSRPRQSLRPTSIPVDLTGKTVVLVDDVLFTGRTARAAMDAIMDFGRPGKVQLLVLVDRGHRELPIRADYVGKNLPTSPDETVAAAVEEVDGFDLVTIGQGAPGAKVAPWNREGNGDVTGSQ